MTTHHRYSPSSMKFRVICPGFDQDQSGDQSRADEGTRLHLAFEKRDLSVLLPEDPADLVKQCIQVAEKLEAGALEIHREVKLQIAGGQTFGTADEVIIKRTGGRLHAVCLDEKYGFGVIDEPLKNEQAWCYVDGVFARWPVEWVDFMFLIPRQDQILHARFMRSDVPDLRARIDAALKRIIRYRETKDASMLRRNEDGCSYCAHKKDCPALTAFAMATAKKYAPLELVDQVHSSEITEPGKMVQLLRASRVLEKMVESVKVHAMQMALQNGGTLLDETGKVAFEIAERAGTRTITDMGLALGVIESHLTDREILSVSKPSLTGVLKLISDKLPRGQKGKVLGEIEQQLADAGAISSGEPTRYLKKARE